MANMMTNTTVLAMAVANAALKARLPKSVFVSTISAMKLPQVAVTAMTNPMTAALLKALAISLVALANPSAAAFAKVPAFCTASITFVAVCTAPWIAMIKFKPLTTFTATSIPVLVEAA